MKAIIYHWWDNYNPIAFKNIRVPILPSIATLRANNSYAPIYVLDCNKKMANWGHFPRKLGFEVVPWKMSYESYNQPDVEFIARLKDIFNFTRQISADEIVYCDSDVFWLKDPLPLFHSPDLFCSNRYNNGFFYFDKNSPAIYQFFELFAAIGLTCLNSPEIVQHITQKTKSAALDEKIVDYLFEIRPELVTRISPIEHATFRDFLVKKINFKDFKMLHCNGLMVENKFQRTYGNRQHSRGLVTIMFKEFYDAMKSVLDHFDLELIFNCDELNYYVPKQVDLLNEDFVERLRSLNLDPSQNFHLKESFSQSFSSQTSTSDSG